VVDDHLMQISHVIRGDEWMSSTPKHILLYQSFGWEPPKFMHMPLLLGKDGKKLSKRKNPCSIFYYRDTGYLPDAFNNFLTLMGYSMTSELEMYSLDQIIKEFDPTRIGVSGAFFDVTKLDWLNQQYLINQVGEKQLWQEIKAWSFNDEFMEKLMPLCHTRIKHFSEFIEILGFMFITNIPYSTELLCPKGLLPEQASMILQCFIWSLDEQENWGYNGVEKAVIDIASAFGVNLKKVIIPILFGAITGKRQGAPVYQAIDLLGKDRTRARFLRSIEFLGGISSKKLDALQKGWKLKNLSHVIQVEP
jgi:glutamyl-tRNA synthetase